MKMLYEEKFIQDLKDWTQAYEYARDESQWNQETHEKSFENYLEGIFALVGEMQLDD